MADLRVNFNQGDEAVRIQQENLRSNAACAVCPRCGKVGYTRAEQKCNVASIVFFCCLSECWFCYQILQKKDLNCYDATHTCTNCNTMIANYNACSTTV